MDRSSSREVPDNGTTTDQDRRPLPRPSTVAAINALLDAANASRPDSNNNTTTNPSTHLNGHHEEEGRDTNITSTNGAEPRTQSQLQTHQVTSGAPHRPTTTTRLDHIIRKNDRLLRLAGIELRAALGDHLGLAHNPSSSSAFNGSMTSEERQHIRRSAAPSPRPAANGIRKRSSTGRRMNGEVVMGGGLYEEFGNEDGDDEGEMEDEEMVNGVDGHGEAGEEE